MEKKVLVETYDNKIVRIPREKLEEFKETQMKIKRLLQEIDMEIFGNYLVIVH